LTTTPATITQIATSDLSPSGDSAAETGSHNDAASETVSPVSNEPKRPSGTERLAGLVYGYEKSPLNWSKTKLKSNAFGDSDNSAVNEANKENDKIGQAPQLTSSYVNTSYTSSLAPQHSSFQHTRRYDYPTSTKAYG
jgi:hypothetical protein